MTAGGGVTYPRVVELLKAEVAKKGQRAVSRESGIALLSVQRYIKGIGEPSQATLQKLAAYFGKSVAWLRGESREHMYGGIDLEEIRDFVKSTDDIIELYYMAPSHLKMTMQTLAFLFQMQIKDSLTRYIAGVELKNEVICEKCIDKLDVITNAFSGMSEKEGREALIKAMVDQIREKPE